jgi:hypothetical protein
VVLPHRIEMGTMWSPFFLLASRGGFGRHPRCLDYSIRSYAARADTNTLGFAVHHGSHSLQIGKPTPLGLVVGMTDIVTSHGSLATDFADAGHMRATLKLNFEKKLMTQQATYAGPEVQGLDQQLTEPNIGESDKCLLR